MAKKTKQNSEVVTTNAEIKKDEKKSNVHDIFKSFHENMESVNLYFKKFGDLAINQDDTIKVQSKQFLDDVIADLNSERERRKLIKNGATEENEESIEQDEEAGTFLKMLAKKISKQPKLSPKNFEILSRSSFLMLNNYFEYLLADLLTYYYDKFQNSLNTKEFKVSLQELNEYETIDEIINHLISKEVESIIVEKTFDQLLNHFEDFLKISLESDIIDWESIIELRERRHLIVHNSSIVNKKYISRTKNPYNFKIGETLNIDNEYFINSFKQLRLAGQLLLFNCWGNWDKENINRAVYEILITSFESLSSNDYDIVCKICKYSEQIKPKNAEQQDYILRIAINNAIALKKQSKKTELNKVLKNIQIGTASPIFKIAHQILEDNYIDLEENFKKAILLGELSIDYYLEWPIFDFVRENEELNTKLMTTF
jgi:hypothetical protein